MQFPPEIISTKLSKLLRHNIIQRLVILGNVIDVTLGADEFIERYPHLPVGRWGRMYKVG